MFQITASQVTVIGILQHHHQKGANNMVPVPKLICVFFSDNSYSFVYAVCELSVIGYAKKQHHKHDRHMYEGV